MSKPRHPSTVVFFVLPLFATLSLIGLAFSVPQITMLSTVLLQVCLVAWGFMARPHGLLLVFFTASVFTFLTGRMLVVGIFGYQATAGSPWGLHINDDDVVSGVLIMQQVFLLGIWVAMSATVRAHLRKSLRPKELHPNKSATYVGFMAMSVGFVLYLVNRRTVVSSIGGSSYLDYYLTRADLETVSGRLGEALLMGGFVFLLASLPSFRNFFLGSAAVLIAHGVDLLIGRRVDFVLSLLLIFFYACLRASMNDKVHNGGKWPSVGKLLLSGLLFFPLIALLNSINRLRFGNTAAGGGLFDAIPEFLAAQGVSANILAYIQTDELAIPEGKFYTFGPLIEFIQARLIPGFDASLYDGQSAARALEGHQFADIFSFRIMPGLYEQGAGYGSSAIAELYWDFGWLGIVFGALLIGFLMAFSSRVLELALPLTALVFLVVRELLYVSRAPYLHWLVGAMNVYNIASLVLLTFAWWFCEAQRRKLLTRPTQSVDLKKRRLAIGG